MKRILFVIPFLSSGGAERVVSIWTSEAAKMGNDVHLLVFYRARNEYPLDKKVILHTVRENKGDYNSLTKLQKLRLLRKKLKEINPDVVLPFISHVGMMISIAKIGLPLKVIETIRIDPKYSPRKRVNRWLRNLSVFLSKGCIVQNKDQLKYFPKNMRKHIRVFANPIANEFTEEEKRFVNKKILNIVAVGRLEKQKNYPMLINAFNEIAKEYKEIKLRIYGEGSLHDKLKELINELNLNERVLLCGRSNNMVKVLKESDLFILSSDAEGMPNSLMEAMAVGLPCISTDCPTGPGDLISHGVDGLLIPTGDRNVLVESITKVINNIDDSIHMGKKAREMILDRYSAQNSTKELITFIESL